jgi:hypothetical protein
MDNGRVAAAIPRNLSRLDEGSIPRPIESHPSDRLPHRATSMYSASISPGTGIAFAKLPTEAIELYVCSEADLCLLQKKV